MTERLGRFRSPDHQARYLEGYDRYVAEHWPSPSVELDIATRFGLTRVRRTGPDHGTPLVLIHPTTGSSLGWCPLIEQFAQGRPVYTPDTIGTIGRSVQTAPVTSAADLVVWLDEVLDGLGLDAVHLVGYSEGGWIAGAHAALTTRPARLVTLSLIEPGATFVKLSRRFLATMVLGGARLLLARDKARAVRAFNGWLNGESPLTDDQVELLLRSFGTFSQRIPMPSQLPDDQLRRITTPTLLLLGADSRIADAGTVAERARRLLPDVTVAITPGAGHGLAFQHPDEVVGRILDFAVAHDATARPA